MISEHTPPHSIEAEQAVLGAMLIDPQCIPEVQARIPNPEMFWRPSHQHMFRAMADLVRDGREPDWVSVAERIDKAGKMAECNGRESLDAYLREICVNLPSSYGVEDHAAIIRDRAIRREAIIVAGTVRDDALRPTVSGAEVAAKAAKHFERLVEDGVADADVDAGAAVERSMEVYRAGGTRAITTGYERLDKLGGGFEEGGLYVIAGRAKRGKSTFLANVAERYQGNEVPFGVVTLEMTISQFANTMLAIRCNVGRDVFRNPKFARDGEDARLLTQQDSLRRGWRIAGRPGMTVDDVCAIARKWKSRYGIKVLIVDHLQRIRATGDDPRHIQIGQMTWALKTLALQTGCVVLLGAQINRESAREPGPPKPHHLKESGSVEEDADGIIGLHVHISDVNREDSPQWEYDVAWMLNRHGGVGVMKTTFVKRTGVITERLQ